MRSTRSSSSRCCTAAIRSSRSSSCASAALISSCRKLSTRPARSVSTMLQAWLRSAGGRASSRPATLAGCMRCSSLPTRLSLPASSASIRACSSLPASVGSAVGWLSASAPIACSASSRDSRISVGRSSVLRWPSTRCSSVPPTCCHSEALRGRQALEQRGDLGRMHALHELAHALVAPLRERLDDLFAERARTAVRACVGAFPFVVHERKDTCGSSGRAPMRESASRPRTVRSDTKRNCWRGSTG